MSSLQTGKRFGVAIRLLALLLVVAVSMGFTPLEPPEDSMRLTAISDRILLIEITKVVHEEPVVNDGVEIRKFTITGKLIEEVRGKGPQGAYNYDGMTMKIIDRKAAEKGLGGAGALDVLAYTCQKRCGAENSKVGERYLVIYSMFGQTFVFIGKDDDFWRKQVLKRIDLSDRGTWPPSGTR